MKITLTIPDETIEKYKKFLIETLGCYKKVTKKDLIKELQAELDANVFQALNSTHF